MPVVTNDENFFRGLNSCIVTAVRTDYWESKMNDADKTDLPVTDANDVDWDKHTLVVQCDKCNNPVNLDDDDVVVTYDHVYCSDCYG